MSTAASVCYHCGEAVPAAATTEVIEQQRHSFCCDGCSAAARWIRDARLADYYRLRTESASRVDADAMDFSSWDRADLMRDHVVEQDGVAEITVLSDGMHCAACAWLIDRALRRESGVVDAGANAITGRIRIRWDPTVARLSALLGRIAALGYRPYLSRGAEREQAQREERNRWLLRLGVAGLGAVQAMMFAEALYLDTDGEMSLATRDFFRWITLLVSSPVVFYSGWPFISGMLRELRHRRLGMDTLIASATLLAYGASVVETMRGGPHVWYDAAVMFVFLLLAARMLEQRARHSARAQVDALARARPLLALREDAAGGREAVAVADLVIGDRVYLSAGDVVPCDGLLLDGEARFEESLLTGEATPVPRRAGDTVLAGSLCRDQAVRIEVCAVGAATRLSQLTRLTERAQAKRPALANSADRVARYFVVTLALVALTVWVGWRIHDPARAFEVVLALLVISCPCALSLSVPAAIAVANGTLSRIGVLVLRADALESLAGTTDIVFDKTGTLGDGSLRLLDVQTASGFDPLQARGIAAALERGSGHPLASAFADIATDFKAIDIRVQAGMGVEGTVDGVRWRLGRADWAGASLALSDAHLSRADFWLGSGGGIVAGFRVEEAPRADAEAAVARLQSLGLQTRLSSGDNRRAVDRMATLVGIEDTHAGQSPEQKLALIHQLQADGRRVAMVGDGLNDAPVLAGADVSMAMAAGSPLAQQSADMVLIHAALQRVPDAVEVARRTQRIIRQNLTWAVGYNVVALPLAAAGLVTPWVAALCMAFSSLTVTLNALRLRRRPEVAARIDNIQSDATRAAGSSTPAVE